MIIVPAIDLWHTEGLSPGTPREPRDVIRDWEWLGFQRIQLVEHLQKDDRLPRRGRAEALLREIHVDAQVAGDICSADDVEDLSRAGATRVILGSRALDEPEWLASSVASFPDLLVVETAAHVRRVRSRGGVRTLPVDLRDLADELSDLPLAGLLVTFAADAALDHADLALVEDITDRLPFPVFVGGGVQTLPTLRDLEFRGVSATIIAAPRLAAAFDEQVLARAFVD
jgi:phosphoribosylformimino-5-aminoimidazole carboxamide ribotide isomerase